MKVYFKIIKLSAYNVHANKFYKIKFVLYTAYFPTDIKLELYFFSIQLVFFIQSQMLNYA